MPDSSHFLVSFGTYYEYLRPDFNLPLADVKIDRFNDGEISVKFMQSLRGKHIFIFGETTHSLTELLLTLDAAKRSSVREITVVLPYYGYSRQDKRESTRGCIGAKVIAHSIESMGIDRVISIDLHAEQIQGYFQVPVEHISGRNIIVPHLLNYETTNNVLCSPDAGGVARVGRIASLTNYPIVTINKRRDKPGSIASMELTGDVYDRDVIIIDDMADSCGTLKKAADLLIDKGATSVRAVTTHPVFSGNFAENITSSKLTELVVINTLNTANKFGYLPQAERSLIKFEQQYNELVKNRDYEEAVNLRMQLKDFNQAHQLNTTISYNLSQKIRIISCAPILQEAIFKIANDESITNLS